MFGSSSSSGDSPAPSKRKLVTSTPLTTVSSSSSGWSSNGNSGYGSGQSYNTNTNNNSGNDRSGNMVSLPPLSSTSGTGALERTVSASHAAAAAAAAGAAAARVMLAPGAADPARLAVDEVKALLYNPDQLSRVAHYRADYAAKKQQLELSLSSAVRTQVDETRLGLTLLVTSADMVARIQTDFKTIDQYCKDCKDLLREYDHIQRVCTARNNLEATARVLANFRTIPTRAKALLNELDDDDLSIKRVYKDLRRLVRLRDKAFEQGSTYTAAMQQQLKTGLQVLQDVANEIEKRVLVNIKDCLDLAGGEKEDVGLLIRSLEVVEMEDKAKRKVFSGIDNMNAGQAGTPGNAPLMITSQSTPSSTMSGNSNSSNSGTRGRAMGEKPHIYQTMRSRAMEMLEKAISETFEDFLVDEETAMKRKEAREKEEEKKKKDKEDARAAIAAKKNAAKKAEEDKKAAAAAAAAKKAAEDDLDDDDDDDDTPRTSAKKPMNNTTGNNGNGGGESSSERMEREQREKAAQAEREKKERDERMKKAKSAAAKSGVPYVVGVLKELRDILKDDLGLIIDDLSECFPPEYQIVQFYEKRYKRFVKIVLNFHCSDSQKLGNVALLKTVVWILDYINTMGNLYSTGVSDDDREDLNRLVEDLMTAYINTTERNLGILIGKILKGEKERNQAEEDKTESKTKGRLFTTGPYDLFFMINGQVDICLEKFRLRNKPLFAVCQMLCRCLTEYQEKQVAFLNKFDYENDELKFGDERIVKDDQWLCAMVNNSDQCRANLSDLSSRLVSIMQKDEKREAAALLSPSRATSPKAKALAAAAASESKDKDGHDDHDDKRSNGNGNGNGNGNDGAIIATDDKPLSELAEEVFEDCGMGFITVATEAVDLLCFVVMAALQMQLGRLFTADWLEATNPPVPNIVATCEDFFGDYTVWITSNVYLERILRRLLRTICHDYVRRLATIKPQPPLNDKFWLRVKEDKKAIKDSFAQFTHIIKGAQIKAELETLKIVKDFTTGDDGFLSLQFSTIYSRWGPGGSQEVFEGLLLTRSDMAKKDRVELVAKFNAYIKDEERKKDPKAQAAAKQAAPLPVTGAYGQGAPIVATPSSSSSSSSIPNGNGSNNNNSTGSNGNVIYGGGQSIPSSTGGTEPKKAGFFSFFAKKKEAKERAKREAAAAAAQAAAAKKPGAKDDDDDGAVTMSASAFLA